MIQLPITERELDLIILNLKKTNPHLYAKLWTYKVNYMNKEKNNGLS